MSNQPNATLYIKNINDKVHKDELKIQLLALFTTYGKIVEIVASKHRRMRGQAFLVFTDLAGATAAMRACEGMIFYDKPLRIDYAKSKSYATLRREDPHFVPPNIATASNLLKRYHDGDAEEERNPKREKSDEDEEEMEIDDDDEDAPPPQKQQQLKDFPTPTSVPQQTTLPSSRLLCTNLPQEVTDDVLSVLFQQYQGFQTTHVTWSPTPNPAGVKVKMGQALFETAEFATTAKEALDGFTLKKGWQMSVVYI